MHGWLMLHGDISDEASALTEALNAYQRARRSFEKLTLCGVGAGSAYALMLAHRFSAEDIWLAPCLCAGGALKRAMRVNRGALFAVMSPIQIMLPEAASRAQRNMAKRILAGVMSKDRRIISYKNDEEARAIIQNAAKGFKIVKTLAR